MTLMKCSECSKEMSDKAESCPNCGNPNKIQQLVAKEADRQSKLASLTVAKMSNIIAAR